MQAEILLTLKLQQRLFADPRRIALLKQIDQTGSIAKELGTDNPEKTGEEVYLLDRISPVANLR